MIGVKDLERSILVTGGAGFIGSHLCRRLLNDGCRVICLDDFETGSEENIADMRENDRFSCVRQDVTEPIDLDVEKIYNLACPASPAAYQNDPVKTIRTSFLGAMQVLELARRCGATVLQASTSEIYGDPLVHPQTEGYRGNVNPIGPRACYDEGKRAAETLFFDYARQYGVEIRVVRIFNTFGPCMAEDDGRVVSNFITQALRGEPITIYGEGSQTRCFCYVSDTVDALIKMMANPSGFRGPVNLGNPLEITVRELAGRIIALTGSKSAMVVYDLPEDDPTRRKPDITLAKNVLGWEPKVSLDDGLIKTIEYFSKRLLSAGG